MTILLELSETKCNFTWAGDTKKSECVEKYLFIMKKHSSSTTNAAADWSGRALLTRIPLEDELHDHEGEPTFSQG